MADVTGIYYHLDELVLVQMRDDVLAALAAARKGERYESMNLGGKGFTKANLSYEQLQQELLEITAALRRIDPETYGGRRTTRLTVSFNGS